jgi:hypothetical protein
MNFEEILSLEHGTFEEQRKDLELSVIMINYCISIINAYDNCNCVIKSQYNFITNKCLREECNKGENVAVTGPIPLRVEAEDCKAVCTM